METWQDQIPQHQDNQSQMQASTQYHCASRCSGRKKRGSDEHRDGYVSDQRTARRSADVDEGAGCGVGRVAGGGIEFGFVGVAEEQKKVGGVTGQAFSARA